jgi:DNA repair exonuclease SbcCD ATPase subunit
LFFFSDIALARAKAAAAVLLLAALLGGPFFLAFETTILTLCVRKKRRRVNNIDPPTFAMKKRTSAIDAPSCAAKDGHGYRCSCSVSKKGDLCVLHRQYGGGAPKPWFASTWAITDTGGASDYSQLAKNVYVSMLSPTSSLDRRVAALPPIAAPDAVLLGPMDTVEKAQAAARRFASEAVLKAIEDAASSGARPDLGAVAMQAATAALASSPLSADVKKEISRSAVADAETVQARDAEVQRAEAIREMLAARTALEELKRKYEESVRSGRTAVSLDLAAANVEIARLRNALARGGGGGGSPAVAQLEQEKIDLEQKLQLAQRAATVAQQQEAAEKAAAQAAAQAEEKAKADVVTLGAEVQRLSAAAASASTSSAAELAKARQDLSDAQAEVAKKENEKKPLQNAIADLKADKARLTSELQQKQQDVTSLTSENATLTARLNTATSSLGTAATVAADLAATEQKLRDRETELTRVEGDLRAKQSELRTITSERDRLSADLTSAQQLASSEGQKAVDLQKKLDEKEVEKTALSERVTELEDKNRILEGNASADHARIVAFESQVQRLTSGGTTAEAEVTKLTDEKAALERDLTSVRSERDQLKTDKSDLDGKLTKCTDDMQTLAADIRNKTSKIAELERKIADLEADVRALTSAKQGLEDDKRRLDGEIQTLSDGKRAAETAKSDLESEKNAKIAELDTKINGLEAQLQSLRQSSGANQTQLADDLRAANDALRIARQEAKDARDALSAAQSKNAGDASLLSSCKSDLSAAQSREAEEKRLKEEAAAALTALQSAKDGVDASLAACTASLSSTEAARAREEGLKKDAQSELQTCRGDLSAARTAASSAEALRDSAALKQEEAERKEREADQKRSVQAQTLATCTGEKQTQLQQINDLQKENTRIVKELGEARAALSAQSAAAHAAAMNCTDKIDQLKIYAGVIRKAQAYLDKVRTAAGNIKGGQKTSTVMMTLVPYATELQQLEKEYGQPSQSLSSGSEADCREAERLISNYGATGVEQKLQKIAEAVLNIYEDNVGAVRVYVRVRTWDKRANRALQSPMDITLKPQGGRAAMMITTKYVDSLKRQAFANLQEELTNEKLKMPKGTKKAVLDALQDQISNLKVPETADEYRTMLDAYQSKLEERLARLPVSKSPDQEKEAKVIKTRLSDAKAAPRQLPAAVDHGPFYTVFEDGWSNESVYTGRLQDISSRTVDYSNMSGPDDYIKGMHSLFAQLASGYCLVVFGYGLSGSGKSYTLAGSTERGEKGVIEIGMDRLRDQGARTSLALAFELYVDRKSGILKDEKLIGTIHLLHKDSKYADAFDDLMTDYESRLDKKVKDGLPLSIDETNWTSDHSRLSTLSVGALNDELEKYRRSKNRVAPTPLNPSSSRSHLFLVFRVEFPTGKTGHLVVMDAAGKENPNTFLELFTGSKTFIKVSTVITAGASPNTLSGSSGWKPQQNIAGTSKTEQFDASAVTQLIREGVYINESIHHIACFLKRKGGNACDSKLVTDPSDYDPNEVFVNPSLEYDRVRSGGVIPINSACTRSDDGKTTCIGPYCRIWMMEILNFLDKKLTNDPNAPTKFVMICNVRQDTVVVGETESTLAFADSVKST